MGTDLFRTDFVLILINIFLEDCHVIYIHHPPDKHGICKEVIIRVVGLYFYDWFQLFYKFSITWSLFLITIKRNQTSKTQRIKTDLNKDWEILTCKYQGTIQVLPNTKPIYSGFCCWRSPMFSAVVDCD